MYANFYSNLQNGSSHSHIPFQMLEKLIQKEGERMVKARCRFPVLQASRLRELMEENKDLQKMDKAELDQVAGPGGPTRSV